MIRVIEGDCRVALRPLGPFDMLLVDPPYGDTSLEWDHRCDDWIDHADNLLLPHGSMWIFGSMRSFQRTAPYLARFGWRLAQDIVWEKHNGSAFHADRFKRVHEHICQYYRGDWSGVFNEVQTTPDAVQRTVRRRKGRPAHTGHIDASPYFSVDGGPRIMRSVIYMRSRHGRAIHPTEKPSDLIEILIRTSCPPNGTVGDLFAGSGAAGEAAMRAGRNYIGCEIDPVMASKAKDRLASILPLAAV